MLAQNLHDSFINLLAPWLRHIDAVQYSQVIAPERHIALGVHVAHQFFLCKFVHDVVVAPHVALVLIAYVVYI